MFGIFSKKLSHEQLLLISIKASILLRGVERQNGLMTHPDEIDSVVRSLFGKEALKFDANDLDRAITYVMAFLTERQFVDRLLVRAMTENLGSFSEQEEREIRKIIAPFL